MVFVSWFTGRAKRPYAAFILLGLPIVIIRDKHKPSKRLLNHEMIHFWQALWLGFIGFWFLYLFFLIQRGYRHNPFEIEAYKHDDDFTYLLNRRPWAWVRYVKRK